MKTGKRHAAKKTALKARHAIAGGTIDV